MKRRARPRMFRLKCRRTGRNRCRKKLRSIRYYNNFFSTYRLGPEDVISVDVFNQDRYSRSGIIVPPSGRISLSLIPGGVFVNGKTVEASGGDHQEEV